MILIAYRHGLRAKDVCELEWSQVEWGRNAALHVRRAKHAERPSRAVLISRSISLGVRYSRFRSSALAGLVGTDRFRGRRGSLRQRCTPLLSFRLQQRQTG